MRATDDCALTLAAATHVTDIGDSIAAACCRLAQDPHPDRCDALAARLRSALDATLRLRRALAEAAVRDVAAD